MAMTVHNLNPKPNEIYIFLVFLITLIKPIKMLKYCTIFNKYIKIFLNYHRNFFAFMLSVEIELYVTLWRMCCAHWCEIQKLYHIIMNLNSEFQLYFNLASTPKKISIFVWIWRLYVFLVPSIHSYIDNITFVYLVYVYIQAI